MLRLTLLAVALCGCGTVCDHAAFAEVQANKKINTCSQLPITEHSAQKCNTGLHSCSTDEQMQIETYARCLDGLAVCEPANNVSWGAQRNGCGAQIFGRLSLACAAAIL